MNEVNTVKYRKAKIKKKVFFEDSLNKYINYTIVNIGYSIANIVN